MVSGLAVKRLSAVARRKVSVFRVTGLMSPSHGSHDKILMPDVRIIQVMLFRTVENRFTDESENLRARRAGSQQRTQVEIFAAVQASFEHAVGFKPQAVALRA